LRCGASAAPNYAEARGAERSKDYFHKLKLVLKELNEFCVWLKIMIRAGFLPENWLEALLDACDQLCRIISAGIPATRQAMPG
jgi:four helix bundle protein